MQKKRRQRLVGGSRARVTDRLLRLRCVGKFGAPIAEKAAAMLCCKPGRFYTPSSWCRLLEDHQGAASGALSIRESCFKGSFFLINDDMELLSQLYRIFNCNSFIFRCTFLLFSHVVPSANTYKSRLQLVFTSRTSLFSNCSFFYLWPQS